MSKLTINNKLESAQVVGDPDRCGMSVTVEARATRVVDLPRITKVQREALDAHLDAATAREWITYSFDDVTAPEPVKAPPPPPPPVKAPEPEPVKEVPPAEAAKAEQDAPPAEAAEAEQEAEKEEAPAEPESSSPRPPLHGKRNKHR